MNEFQTLNGFRIVENNWMPEFIFSPCRKHEGKNWMNGRAYHSRIQKKWNKRFGIKKERLITRQGDLIFAHPGTVVMLNKEFQKYR